MGPHTSTITLILVYIDRVLNLTHVEEGEAVTDQQAILACCDPRCVFDADEVFLQSVVETPTTPSQAICIARYTVHDTAANGGVEAVS